MQHKHQKILIAGVGGQGIVYLTNIIAEASVIADIPICVSEIHGLSQRGGIVVAGIGLGEHCTGFIGKASVDLLIGLESLETQRCIPYLHKRSSVLFGINKIIPYSVNAGMVEYPNIESLFNYLNNQCKQVVFVKDFPKDINSVLYNVYMLGIAIQMKALPFKAEQIQEAIKKIVHESQLEKSLAAFNQGLAYKIVNQKRMKL